MTLVTAVIPNYNYARFVGRAIDSVLGQTYREIEIVVVDDGSRDESLDVLTSYGKAIRVIRQSNQGVSAARNAGIAAAQGEFVAFLDADDEWAPEKIEAQVEALRDPQVGLVHCGVTDVDASGQTLGEQRDGLSGQPLREHVLLERTVLGGGSGAMLRRRDIEVIGRFDPQLSTSADWDMWRRAMTRRSVAYVNAPMLRYRHHGSGAMHHNMQAFERDMLYAFDRTFSDPHAHRVHPLRRRAYARLYALLFLEYARLRKPGRAGSFALRSAMLEPATLAARAVRSAKRVLRPRD